MGLEDVIKKHIDELLTVLGKSSDYAKTATLLAYELHWEPGAVEDWVNRARLRGHLILDNERGYYLGATREEVETWQQTRLVPQILSLFNQLLATNRTIIESTGIPMEGDDG